MENRQNFVWDDRAPSFRQVGDVAISVAEVHCGVAVDEVTRERWRDLMAVLREFDTYHDDTGVSRSEAMSELRSFRKLGGLYPSIAPDMLPVESQEKLLRRVDTILSLGECAAKTAEVPEFIACRDQEARHTARLLDDAATDYVVEQPAYQHNFVPTMASLSLVACALDSMTDARKDYMAGAINIRPNREYYEACAGMVLREAHQGLAALKHSEILKQFGVMSVNRLRNRVRRGVSDESSVSVVRSLFHRA